MRPGAGTIRTRPDFLWVDKSVFGVILSEKSYTSDTNGGTIWDCNIPRESF